MCFQDTPYGLEEDRVEMRKDVLNDVYAFDVEATVWTRIATLVGNFNAVCAVSGDSLILYGGY